MASAAIPASNTRRIDRSGPNSDPRWTSRFELPWQGARLQKLTELRRGCTRATPTRMARPESTLTGRISAIVERQDTPARANST